MGHAETPSLNVSVDPDLSRQLADHYQLSEVALTDLGTPVNDVVAVVAAQGDFALKLYHRNRTVSAVQWEVDLVTHLQSHGVPVAQPVSGRTGNVVNLVVAGQPRVAVLYVWAPGTRPSPSHETYSLLGEAAALIHRAADDFAPSPVRESYDSAVLVDDQLDRMQHLLVPAGRWQAATALGERLKSRLAVSSLDWGICHMDLSLDNVHVAERLTVFDFDSAGTSWRAIEPAGVLRFSAAYFQTWLAGYRTARPFTQEDEAAVAAFGILGDLRAAAWRLGVAASSRGTPLLTVEDLPAVVDGWLEWESGQLPPAWSSE